VRTHAHEMMPPMPRLFLSRSSGCKRAGPFTEDYGGGSASGVFGSDTVEVAGLRAHNFTFGIIRSLALEGASGGQWDGILGLTFHNRRRARPTTFLSALYDEGALCAREITFLLMDPPLPSDPFMVSGAFPSCARPGLTEIHLCHACSCHESEPLMMP
jgi:hypothetical protein